MRNSIRRATPAGVVVLLLLAGVPTLPPAEAQDTTPLPPRDRKGKQSLRSGADVNPAGEDGWGLPREMLERLATQARIYRDYAVRFTCRETARSADYDASEYVSGEKMRQYAYLLVRDEGGQNLAEFRQKLNKEGRPKGDNVDDAAPFPPAYAWVFLFSEHNQPFFSYRDLGDRFEGFDWVREIQFRGALNFTDGKDIRQWEGTVLVDASSFTPIEIRAQPTHQDEKIEAQYRAWANSFNLIGFKMGPKPMAYRSHVQFRLRQDGLTFPTELRYDTLRAVSAKSARRVKASTRVYDEYRFFKTGTQEAYEAPGTN
jgi:hypothetical protein